MTIIVGMDTIPDLKLKDVSKAFSKRFAGSSSVKDTAGGGKEVGPKMIVLRNLNRGFYIYILN